MRGRFYAAQSGVGTHSCIHEIPQRAVENTAPMSCVPYEDMMLRIIGFSSGCAMVCNTIARSGDLENFPGSCQTYGLYRKAL